MAMTRVELNQVFRESASMEFADIPSNEEQISFSFSDKFIQKVEKLIARQRKLYWNFVNTATKRVAIVAILFLTIASVVFSNEEARASMLQWCEDVYEEYINPQREVSSVFRVSDNYLILQDDEKIRIEGIILQKEGNASSLGARFDNAEEKNGVFPSFGRITLKFEEEIPLRVNWSIDDGVSVPGSSRKDVIEEPQKTTVIDIGVSKALPLSSNYDTMPNRKLRIVCQYRTYSVEYLLVISANPEM